VGGEEDDLPEAGADQALGGLVDVPGEGVHADGDGAREVLVGVGDPEGDDWCYRDAGPLSDVARRRLCEEVAAADGFVGSVGLKGAQGHYHRVGGVQILLDPDPALVMEIIIHIASDHGPPQG